MRFAWLLGLMLLLNTALEVAQAAPSDANFAPVSPNVTVQWPSDTGAHPAFRTEWWYVTGWLTADDSKQHPEPIGFQVTFFRSATGHGRDNPSAFAPTQMILAHVALSDPSLGHLVHEQKIARQGWGLAEAARGNTDVQIDGWHLQRSVDGTYRVEVDAATLHMQLILRPTQAPMLQGQGGYSQKGPLPSEASYYYSEPQLSVTGRVARKGSGGNSGAIDSAVRGSAWLDHEWSSNVLDHDAVGWDWLGANLDDGSALMAFRIRAADGHTIWAHAALRDAKGEQTRYRHDTVRFDTVRTWRSPRTDIAYPVAQTVATGATSWSLVPLFDDQELDARTSAGALYWEGAVRIVRDRKAVGRGYLEMTGYGKPIDLQH